MIDTTLQEQAKLGQLPTTNNRFIKVDGAFERPGQSLQGMTSNTANSPLPQSTDMPAPSTSASPLDNFNLLLTGLLKGAQGVSTADYLARKRALDRAVVDKTSSITPEDMRSLSPDQQNSVRSGNIKALQPDIDQNAYEIEKAQQSIDNFFKVHEAARKLGQDFADKMVAPDSVIKNAQKVIEANPDLISQTLAGFNDKSKQAIIGGLDYSKVGTSKKTQLDTSVVDLGGGKKVLINNQTGETIRELNGDTTGVVSPLKLNALTTAQALLSKFDKGQGTSAVGKSGFLNSFGYGLIPGTANANFKVDFDNLKSLLSLDNVNLLKGQGAVSDAERALLASAVTKLNLAQSEEEFRTTLDSIVKTLSNSSGATNKQLAPDEIQYLKSKGYTDKQIQDYANKQSFNSAGNASASNRPQVNNNPLNIKASAYTQSFPGVSGFDPVPAKDGGKFLVFNSADDGFAAAERLLTSGVYSNLSVDSALRKWSGNGYGGEIAPQFRNRRVSSLSPSEIQSLLQTMAVKEGYFA